MTKWEFIENELIAATIAGAFQRAKIYKESCSDQDRVKLRDSVSIALKEYKKQYYNKVDEELHKTNIIEFADSLTVKHANNLENDKFRIGIAQKSLNLYLKYLWCLDKIETPPHCPFDSIIINQLGLNEEQKKKHQWTKLDCIDGYQFLVDAGKKKIEKSGYETLAEWELHTWSAFIDPKNNQIES